MTITIGRNEKSTVKIVDPQVSHNHVELTFKDDNRVMVRDLDSTNGTYYNGVRFMQKELSINDTIMLGPSFKLKLKDAMPKPNTYSIAPLQNVWEQYEKSCEQLDNQQNRYVALGKFGTLFSMLNMGVGVTFTFMKENSADSEVNAWKGDAAFISFILMGIAIALTIYSTIKSNKFNLAKEKKRLLVKLQDEYVCPNPDCRHFVGNKPWRLLCQDRSCPNCKVRWVDETE